MVDSQVGAFLRQLRDRQESIERQQTRILDKYEEFIKACEAQPQSITAEIDSIPGRRIWYTLTDRLRFTTANSGLRATPLTFLISQDGPFIATHYPLVIWRPVEPGLASKLGAWSPVSSWPLPTEAFATDVVNLSYEVTDSGSQRNFQNESVGPLFSRPDNIVPLPVPTLFAPNTVIQFFPTFESILFDPTALVPTTAGELVVSFPGYRIVNM